MHKRQNTSLFETAFQLAPEPLVLVREDGVIEAANVVATALLEIETLDGKAGRLSYYVSDERGNILDWPRSMGEQQMRISGELMRRHHADGDGRILCEGTLVRPRTDDTGAVMLLRFEIVRGDIQLALPGQLEPEGEIYRSALSSMGGAVIATGVDERITFMNAAAEQQTGWRDCEVRGWPLEDVLTIVNIASRKPVRSPATAAMMTESVVKSAAAVVLIARDGTEHPIEDSAAAIKNEKGELLGAVISFQDVSERRFSEKRIAETLKKEQRLRADAEQSNHMKDEFLATLAHELRNPLAPVRNAVHVFRLVGSDEPELRWAREVIERQIEHLTRLSDDLMDVSRISRNNLELRNQKVELGAVIKVAVQASRPTIEQCGHELTVSLPSQPIFLNGDPVRLARVFLNLLNNSAKYTSAGGHIRLTAKRDRCDAVVQVKDDGAGIPVEELPRLFEMFFQANRPLGRSRGGLGIGLSLVRRLVQLHGGSVEARSEGIGKGCEFTVRLPVLVEELKPLQWQEPGGHGKKSMNSSHILVVDDDRDTATTLAMLLRLVGNEVHVAYDGAEAVEAAERLRPAMVMLDIGMPKLDGYEAAQQIRQQPWGKGVVLVALTGSGQETDKRRAEAAGFDHHFTKPVDLAALEKILIVSKKPDSGDWWESA